MLKKFLLTVGCAFTLSTGAFAGAVPVDPQIPAYQSTSGVSGVINSIGSDTLNNLMTLWAEGFKAIYPNVKIQIEGKGSATAPPALIEGTAQIGPMSRLMKPTEIDEFEKKYGYKPTAVKVSVDALAIFVHKDNPLKSISMKNADGVFSSTFKRGGTTVTNWGQLGVTGAWAARPLSLYGRNSASGTYGFFKDEVLLKGDFKPTVKEQPGSSAVVQSVSSDLNGVGYSGIGYATSGVRALPIAGDDGVAYEPTYDNCLQNKYPLGRFLYLYINKKPGAPADKLIQEFVRYVASKQGQEVVVKDGYYPLPLQMAQESDSAVK